MTGHPESGPPLNPIDHNKPEAVGPDLRRTDIMLIEASAPARYALRLRLKALGATVRQAQSVEQALPALRLRPPHLIIAAPVLPGINALELLDLLRQIGPAGAPPMLIHHCGTHWPLAEAAAARGVPVVTTDAELLRQLPKLLRCSTERSALGADATKPSPGDPQATALVAPHGATARSVEASSQRPVALCWRLALAVGVAGLLLGVLIARLTGL